MDKPVHNELLGGEQLPTRLMQPIRSPHDAMENIAILRTRFLWTAAGSPRRFRCARKFFLLDGGYAVSIAPMNIILGSAIDAWTEAVADAESAEKLLDQSWHLHLDGLGPAVTEGFVKEVAQFRSRAQARLAIVLALMNPATDESPLAIETERGQHRFLCA